MVRRCKPGGTLLVMLLGLTCVVAGLSDCTFDARGLDHPDAARLDSAADGPLADGAADRALVDQPTDRPLDQPSDRAADRALDRAPDHRADQARDTRSPDLPPPDVRPPDQPAPSCFDGKKNGTETDIDCGSTCPKKCGYGKGCAQPTDCATGVCGGNGLCACSQLDDCAAGSNCQGGKCVAAQASCAAQRTAYPTSKDGVYWVGPATSPYRAYCDMQLQAELCAETPGSHAGKTREGSGLAYTMTSQLLYSAGVCELWALRATTDGYPLDRLHKVAGLTMTTCAALGFVADGALGTCGFGSNYKSDCGFPISSNYYRYGNLCNGCSKNDGPHAAYVLQGYMGTASVLTSVDGKTRTRCKVK